MTREWLRFKILLHIYYLCVALTECVMILLLYTNTYFNLEKLYFLCQPYEVLFPL